MSNRLPRPGSSGPLSHPLAALAAQNRVMPPILRQPVKTTGSDKKFRVAVIPKAATQEYWKSVHAGAAKAAQEMGNVEVLWKGPVHDDNREEQGNLVEDFVTQKVDGICLAPVDSSSLLNAVKGARIANLPVIIFDSGLDDKDLYQSFVATDNYNGGRLARRRWASG